MHEPRKWVTATSSIGMIGERVIPRGSNAELSGAGGVINSDDVGCSKLNDCPEGGAEAD